jgi:hypothetical protein
MYRLYSKGLGNNVPLIASEKKKKEKEKKTL